MSMAVRSFHSCVPCFYRGAWIAVASSVRSRNDPDSSDGSDVVAGLSAKEEKTYRCYFHMFCTRFVEFHRTVVDLKENGQVPISLT